jgi:hypothetical protein
MSYMRTGLYQEMQDLAAGFRVTETCRTGPLWLRQGYQKFVRVEEPQEGSGFTAECQASRRTVDCPRMAGQRTEKSIRHGRASRHSGTKRGSRMCSYCGQIDSYKIC